MRSLANILSSGLATRFTTGGADELALGELWRPVWISMALTESPSRPRVVRVSTKRAFSRTTDTSDVEAPALGFRAHGYALAMRGAMRWLWTALWGDRPRSGGLVAYLLVTDYVNSLHRAWWVSLVVSVVAGLLAFAVGYVVTMLLEARLREMLRRRR
jgi:hypothetical protein